MYTHYHHTFMQRMYTLSDQEHGMCLKKILAAWYASTDQKNDNSNPKSANIRKIKNNDS